LDRARLNATHSEAHALMTTINAVTDLSFEGDIGDTMWIKGYGWPVYRGGPMYWAELVGLDTILQWLHEFQRLHGDEFKPAPLLERLVVEGKGVKPS